MDLFLESFGQKCKTKLNHQTLSESTDVSFDIWIQVISFLGHVLCVAVCLQCVFILDY